MNHPPIWSAGGRCDPVEVRRRLKSTIPYFSLVLINHRAAGHCFGAPAFT